MEIEWFRDLVISIVGLVTIGVLIFISVLCYLLYRKINPMLESAKSSFMAMQDISTYFRDKISKPLIDVTAIVRGILQGIDICTKFTKEKEGEKDV